MEASTTRRRRADGERTRAAILDGASKLATVEGLGGLSIGSLADHIGISKSGLYAHFDSKEDLQLATIDAAQETFENEVTKPGLDHPAGVAQILGLCEEFFRYLERRVFPGGCFFAAAAAEFDTHEGRVKDRILVFYAEWLEMLTGLVRDGQRRGELDEDEDPEALAFEIDSLLLGANAAFVLFEDERALEWAMRAVRRRLGLNPRTARA
jgi:AcrR family transcriptional regulator